MGTLYQLTANLQEALANMEIAESGEEIAAILSELDGLETDWTVKAADYARALRNVEADAEALDAEIKRLTARKKRTEAIAEAMKYRMKTSMKALGLEKAETPIGTWKIGKGREAVEILDPGKVPEQYLIHPAPTVSKTAVMAAYKDTGEIVPGCDIVRHETFGLR